MNNKFSRIVCGFLSVVMCICSTVHMTNISAEEVEIIPEVEDAISVEALSIVLERGSGNYVEINEWTQVQNGDKLSLDFEWEALNDDISPPVTFVYDMSDKLKNLSLDEIEIPTADATYRVNGQKLYIEIAKGKAGRSGTCRLEGTVDLSGAEVDDAGVTQLQFVNKVVEAYAPSKVTGVLTEKVASEFKLEDGKYYQYFKVKVINNSAEKTVTGATLTDTFASNDNLYTSGAKLEGYTMTHSADGAVELRDSSNNAISSDVAPGTTVKIPEMAAGEYVTVTYKVQVDKEGALSQKNGENVATVEYDKDGTPAASVGRARANPSVPSVSKTSNFDAANEKITYTITVNPGSMVSDDENFVVLDTPDGISADDIAGAINDAQTRGTATVSGTSVNIPVSVLGTPDANGTYIFTYTVDLPDNFKNQIVSKDIENNLSVTFDDEYTYEDNDYIYIPASGIALINKSVESVNYETGVIDWKVDLFIPNDDSAANKLKSFVFYDDLNNYVSGVSGDRGNSNFDVDTILNSINVSVEGVDCGSITSIATRIEEWSLEKRFAFNLNEAFLKANLGKTVTLKYSSIMNTNVDDYERYVYTNTGTVIFKYEDDIQHRSESNAYVSPDFYSVKKSTAARNPANNAFRWSIILKSHKYNFTSGETFTVKDVLPVGYRISDACIDIQKSFESQNWNDTYDDLISYTTSLDAENDVQTVTFTITVDDTIKPLVDRTGDNCNFSISYEAAMTPEYYEKFNLNNPTGVPVDITNNATVRINNKDYYLSNTTQATPVVPSDILSKSAVSEKILDGNDLETGKFKATYTIIVNENGEKLLENASDLTLTDKLGTWLELVESSIRVEPAAENVSYDKATRTITFNLKDERKYEITYDVTGDLAKFNGTGDTSYIDPSYSDAMFSNTVTLKGEDSLNVSQSVKLDKSTYETDATYQYNILIKGKKFWVTPYDSVVPKKVTVWLKETKEAPDGTITVTNNKNEFEVQSVNGDWEYTIDQLVSKDKAGNRYTYEILEVKVGGDETNDSGYDVTYEVPVITETNDYTIIQLDFTNDFVADDNEIGKLQITKTWDHSGNAGEKPTSAEIKVYAEGVNTPVATGIVSASTPLVFTDLPLYTYSRNDNDKLVRIPREYYVVEEEITGYKAVYNVNAGSDKDSCDKFTLSAGSQANVAITNTYNGITVIPKTSIKVTKAWDDENNADGTRPATIDVILTSDSNHEITKTITGSGEAVFEDLLIYKSGTSGEKIKYTIKEKSVPDGYTETYSVNNEEFELIEDTETDITITNKHTPNEYGKLTVSKNWNDTGLESLRPSSVAFELRYNDGTTDQVKTISYPSEIVFEDLPVYKVIGGIADKTKPVEYTLTEGTVTGYTASYSLNGGAASANCVFTLDSVSDASVAVTNTCEYTIEYGSIEVDKKWLAADETPLTIWQRNVDVVLTDSLNSNPVTKTITETEKALFTNLPVKKYTLENGVIKEEIIKYFINEIPVSNFTASYSVSPDAGVTLTAGGTAYITVTNKQNDAQQEEGTLTITKKWEDDNKTALRGNVTVTVKADEINKSWSQTIAYPGETATFTSLPVHVIENGVIKSYVKYTVTEKIIEGYETVVYSDSIVNGFTFEASKNISGDITNKLTFTEPKGSITVNKEWQDKNGNVISTAPEKITIELTSSNGFSAIQDIEIGDDTATFTGLHVYKSFERINGQIVGVDAITYSVRETLISSSDYETTISPDGSFTLENASSVSVKITNKQKDTTSPAPVVEKAKIIIKKEWTGDTNATSSRPATITFILKADGVELDRATVDSDLSGDVAEFKDLAVKKASGEKILYEVVEEAVTGYTTTYSVNGAFELLADEEKSIVVYNTYNVPSQSESSSNTTTSTVTTTVSGTNTTTSATTTTKAPTSSVVPPVTSPVVPSQTTTTKVTTTTAAPVVVTTTSAKNTTTTAVAPDTTEEEKEETTVITKEEEKPEVTTTADSDTDTTKPAETTEDLSEETTDIDDFTGSDSGITSDIEENPHTSITINFGYVLAFAFGTYAFFPRKKKRK